MSFDYDKIKKKQESGEQWTSYSDLFMVLSIVFLLLYVVASLRTGTHTLQQQIHSQELADRALDLEKQIKTYDNLKESYLEESASDKEQKVYSELMDKLSLLQEENNEEASKLRAKASENEKKELALNQYQQIIRNIINANVLSKSKIKRRDRTIASDKVTIEKQIETLDIKEKAIKKRDETIALKESEIKNLDNEVLRKKKIISQKNKVIAQKKRILRKKQSEIGKLNKDIKAKKGQIRKNVRKISRINKNLKTQVKKLKREKSKRKISKKNYLRKMKNLKSKSIKEIALLDRKNKKINIRLKKVKRDVKSANKLLTSANSTIKNQKRQKVKLAMELDSAQSQKATLDAELRQVQTEVKLTKEELEKTKRNFQAQVSSLETQKTSLEGQRSKLQNQKKLLSSQRNELKQINKKLKTVNTKLHKDKKQLKVVSRKLSEEKKQLARDKTKLKTQKNRLSKELRKAQKILNAKKKLAKQISANFKKAGIKANVDSGTGEVVLSFGNSYFDNGKSNLKSRMRKALNKFMPIYAESIFKDPEIAKKIKAVDIIGFSSPTYRGRYVNPNSLKAKDRKAIEYNTNLSIERAKSVFKYIIDTNKLSYARQDQITPLLKVSGRSYFSRALSGRAPAKDMSKKEFCSMYDCKKEQKVIIRFELDHK